jgi:hypothetical protein
LVLSSIAYSFLLRKLENKINHLPDPEQFIYEAIRHALETQQKPSKWAQLADRIAGKSFDLEEHTEQFKQDIKEFKQKFTFKIRMNYLLNSNTLSDLFNPSALEHHKILQHLATLTNTDKASFSILKLYEFEYGFANAPDNKKTRIRQKIIQVQKDFKNLITHSTRRGSFWAVKEID